VFSSRATVGTYTDVDAGTSDTDTGGGDSNSTQALGGGPPHGSRSSADADEIEMTIPDSFFPDNTTLEDYPDDHILDPDDVDEDMEAFILDTHDDGHVEVQRAEDSVPDMTRNGVKGDAFHVIQSYKKTLKKKHGMFATFSGLLRDAIFMVNEDDMERERKKLSDTLFENPNSPCHENREESDKEASRRLYCPGSKVLEDVQRTIPPPDVLLPRIKRAVDMCANAKDAKTGETFFSKKMWKAHARAWSHFEKGCYSDKPGYSYYYFTTSKSGKKQLMCVRGTSALEGFHKHLRRIFPGFHTSPLLATCLLALFVYRWNMDRAAERGLIPEEYAEWYSHETIVDMQQLSDQIPGVDRLHDDFVNFEDFLSTGETFYTPIMKMAMRLQEGVMQLASEDVAVEGVVDLSASMEFAAMRDGQQSHLPITPVLPCERTAILDLLSRHRSTRRKSVNQHGSIDYDAATTAWNSLCDDEMVKPVEKRAKMFPKTASLLRKFHNDEDRRENERRTLRQIVDVESSGVVHPILLRRGVHDVRQELQDGNKRAEEMPTPRPEPAPLPRPTTVEQGQGDAVALPPMEVHAATCNASVMETVREGRHLGVPVPLWAVPPAPIAVTHQEPASQYRCYRCGLHKTGKAHASNSAKNSIGYCTVAPADRFPGWIVPPGYEVSDTRKASDARTVKRAWKRHKEVNGIVEHEDFQDW